MSVSPTKSKEIFEVDEYIYTWEEVDSKIEHSNWATLYGNGMSMAFYNEGFSYNKLADKVKLKDLDVKKLLDEVVKDNNLESLLLKLSDSRDVVQIIDDARCPPASAALSEKYKGVQESFIRTVNELHPDTIFTLNLSRLKEYVLKFRWVFTTNYDLLTYWSLVKDIPYSAPREAYSKFTDFFWRKEGSQLKYHDDCEFLKGGKTCVYYVHGALHIFNADYGESIKISPRKETTLSGEIEEKMKKGSVPLFVSEGDSGKKELRIKANSYLRFCYKEMRTEKMKSLLIFGQSLADNDAHLFNTLLQNESIKDMWYGVYISNIDGLDDEEIGGKVKTEVEGLKIRAKNAIKRHAGNHMPLSPKTIHIFIANGLSDWITGA